MNKVRAFLLRPFVRAAIAGGPSTVDMDEVLDTGGICLVRIAQGALGVETARLVGSLVVARTWQAATRRARIPQRQRRDAALYIDECHNFLNLAYPLEDMLAEARGLPAVAMTLAHQYLGQLPRELEEGISTNARSKIFFNASPEDARELARHTRRGCPITTSPTSASTTPPRAWSWAARRRRRSPAAPSNCRPRFPAAPGRSAPWPGVTRAPAPPPRPPAAARPAARAERPTTGSRPAQPAQPGRWCGLAAPTRADPADRGRPAQPNSRTRSSLT